MVIKVSADFSFATLHFHPTLTGLATEGDTQSCRCKRYKAKLRVTLNLLERGAKGPLLASMENIEQIVNDIAIVRVRLFLNFAVTY